MSDCLCHSFAFQIFPSLYRKLIYGYKLGLGSLKRFNTIVCMKRTALIKHLRKCGASLLREGKRHSIYQRGIYKTEVPRHNEIVDILARKICKDLDIPFMR